MPYTPTLASKRSTAVDVIKAILYELQPIRYSDAVKLTQNCWSLLIMLLTELISIGAEAISNAHSMVADISIRTGLLCVAWSTACYLCVHYGGFEMLQLYVTVSLFCGIFATLGTRKAGDISAYSVFNRNQRGILGALTVEQFENELRHRAGVDDGDDDEGRMPEMEDVLIMEDNGHGNAGNIGAGARGGGGGGGGREKKKKR
jgi:hypothetical protein